MDANGLSFWMLSQLNDWLPPWRAVTAYIPGQGIVDPNGNIQLAQTAGTSNAIAPTWSTTLNQITVDAGVTWLNAGPGTWQAATAFSAGQYILDPNGNLQCAVAIAGNGSTGAAQPVWPVAIGETVVDGNVTWSCAGPTQAGLFYCSKSNRLQLRSMRTGAPPAEDFTTATSMVGVVPMTLDQFGNYARWDAASSMVMAGGSGPDGTTTLDEVPIYAPGRTDVTDLAMGYDGILYVAVGGSLVMIDRRLRWPNFTLTVSDFSFWRLAALPEGGVLALDRNKPQLAKVSGQPLETGPADTPYPGILRPCNPNPNPPQIAARIALPASETFVALAPLDMTQQPPQFALLSWGVNSATNQVANFRIANEATNPSAALQIGAPWQLGGVRLPYTVNGLGNQKFAVLATNLNEALIYDLSDAGETLVPDGETYILAANNVGPFVHGFDLPPNYANVPGNMPLMLPLLPLSLNTLAARGATNPSGPAIIDSGISQAVWHRIFLEAIVPPRCGAVLWLTASDRLADLVDPATHLVSASSRRRRHLVDPGGNAHRRAQRGVAVHSDRGGLSTDAARRRSHRRHFRGSSWSWFSAQTRWYAISLGATSAYASCSMATASIRRRSPDCERTARDSLMCRSICPPSITRPSSRPTPMSTAPARAAISSSGSSISLKRSSRASKIALPTHIC